MLLLVSCVSEETGPSVCVGACDDLGAYDASAFEGDDSVDGELSGTITQVNALSCWAQIRDYWNGRERWDTRCWSNVPALGATYLVVTGRIRITHFSGAVTTHDIRLNRGQEVTFEGPGYESPSSVTYTLRLVVGARSRAWEQTADATGTLWSSWQGREQQRTAVLPIDLWRTNIRSEVTFSDHGQLEVYARTPGCSVVFTARNHCPDAPINTDFYVPTSAARFYATLFGQDDIFAEVSIDGPSNLTIAGLGNRDTNDVSLRWSTR